MLGAAYYRAGKWDEAKTALSRAQEQKPAGRMTDVWLLLAMTRWQKGDLAKARQDLQKAKGHLDAYKNGLPPDLKRLADEARGLVK